MCDILKKRGRSLYEDSKANAYIAYSHQVIKLLNNPKQLQKGHVRPLNQTGKKELQKLTEYQVVPEMSSDSCESFNHRDPFCIFFSLNTSLNIETVNLNISTPVLILIL